ncbi:hypothetical protein M1O55_00480 [Dehalococcoidia bacterium]|jgi:hypothetical protein|nr:hypothetical protein [Dehalococcoidia bacterium]MDP7628385.1 hypothetical protein [SAR202 cluster bacterium]
MTQFIDLGQHKQLFLDNRAVEATSGVVRRIHQPKNRRPVLQPDRSIHQVLVQSNSAPQWNPEKHLWEWWYLAFYDKAPYQGLTGSPDWGDIHYATSKDGVHWEQPSLGLYEWRGSLENNLAYHSKVDYLRRRGARNPVDIGERRLHHIIRDEKDPDPQRRYKGLFSDADNSGRYPALSYDGFHWTFPHVDGIPSQDTSHMAYDDYNNRFVATVKQRTEWGRSVYLSTSDDFIEWTEPVLILHTDEIDQFNRGERVRKIVEDPSYLSPPHIDEETDFIAQLYMMPIMPYEGQYVGFPLILNPSGLDLAQMNHVGLNQTELAVSWDLTNWERVADRNVFLGVEPWDGINYGTCQVAVCGRPIVRDKEIWIYFDAVRFRGVPESYPSKYAEFFNDMGALSLATLRLDGFVSMDAETKGTLLTKPFFLNEGQLFVNVESQQGELKAEVVDSETNDVLPGLSLADCDPVRADDTNVPVTWNHRGVPVRKNPVRLRFELSNAKLYAFWLSN